MISKIYKNNLFILFNFMDYNYTLDRDLILLIYVTKYILDIFDGYDLLVLD